MRILVATAVAAERSAVLRGLSSVDDVAVEVVGVGPASAAAHTARLLARADRPYGLVVSAGIAGGFPGRAEPGAVVIGTRSVAADLGADGGPDGFIPLAELGFGLSFVDSDPVVLAALRSAMPTAVVGEVLTVSTVTGTAARATQLADRHPLAVAEGMEGFGVAIAAASAGVTSASGVVASAAAAGVAFVELRTIANPVGPRDRGAWRIDDALDALTVAAGALLAVIHQQDPTY